MLEMPASGTVLAFDFGEKRIGVAVGELALGVAHPLTTLAASRKEARFAAIAALVAEWQPALFVVGLPHHLDGGEHAFAIRCRRFARQLMGRFHRPAVMVDERLTSVAAEEDRRATGGVSAATDALAASHILQRFFDEHRARAA